MYNIYIYYKLTKQKYTQDKKKLVNDSKFYSYNILIRKMNVVHNIKYIILYNIHIDDFRMYIF